MKFWSYPPHMNSKLALVSPLWALYLYRSMPNLAWSDSRGKSGSCEQNWPWNGRNLHLAAISWALSPFWSWNLACNCIKESCQQTKQMTLHVYWAIKIKIFRTKTSHAKGPEVYESKDMSSLLFNEHAWNKYIIQYCGNIHIEFQKSMKLLLLLIRIKYLISVCNQYNGLTPLFHSFIDEDGLHYCPYPSKIMKAGILFICLLVYLFLCKQTWFWVKLLLKSFKSSQDFNIHEGSDFVCLFVCLFVCKQLGWSCC